MTDVTHMIYYKSDFWTQWDYISFQMCVWHSQFNGFVPHDGVSWEGKGLHIHNVDVSSFRANVQPFTLEGQMTERYPKKKRDEERVNILLLFIIYQMYKLIEPLTCKTQMPHMSPLKS